MQYPSAIIATSETAWRNREIAGVPMYCQRLMKLAILLAIAPILWGVKPAQARVAARDEPAAEPAGWSPSLEWHGFGSWFYGKTDGNAYLGGSHDGDYRNFDMGLDLKAEPVENLEIRAQVSWDQDGDEKNANIDYGFAEWRFSDALRLRVGQAQHPFGLYTEVFDIGTLRPFLSLPQSFYGPVGLAVESYKGLGLTGSRALRGGWRANYDAYGGGVDLTVQNELLGGGAAAQRAANDSLDDVLGGRLSFEAPGGALSFGASAYGGREIDTRRRHRNVALHGQYLTDDLWLRAEAGRHEERGEQTARAGYLEAAYFLTPHWQAAGRYDRVQTDVEEPVPGDLRSVLTHREVALGLNYWFNRLFVLKLSLHDVKGNRFTTAESVDAPAEEKTRYFAFGAQFTF